MSRPVTARATRMAAMTASEPVLQNVARSLPVISQIISVLFVIAILAAGVGYFRRNPLAWLVMKPWQRVVVVVAALGIAFMLIAGYPLLADRITPFGYIALLAALGLLIWWIIRDSRRL